jgi:hypothetical protein
MTELSNLVKCFTNEIINNKEKFKEATNALIDEISDLDMEKNEFFKKILKLFSELDIENLDKSYEKGDWLYCIILKGIDKVDKSLICYLETLKNYIKKILCYIEENYNLKTSGCYDNKIFSSSTSCVEKYDNCDEKSYCLTDNISVSNCSNFSNYCEKDKKKKKGFIDWNNCGIELDHLSKKNIKMIIEHVKLIKNSLLTINKIFYELHCILYKKANIYNLYEQETKVSNIEVDYIKKSFDILYEKTKGVLNVNKNPLNSKDNYVKIKFLLNNGDYFILGKTDSIRIRKECQVDNCKLIIDIGPHSYQLQYLKENITNRRATDILTNCFISIQKAILTIESNITLIDEIYQGIKTIFKRK